MALDEPKDGDEVLKEQGITFLIEKSLFDEAKPIGVEFIETPRGSGFKLTSSMVSTGGCGSSCSSC